MERSKIIAVVCAIIAALLVIAAGKSCADGISESNKKNRTKPSDSQSITSGDHVVYNYNSRTGEPEQSGYDTAGQTEPAEIYEEVTDVFGNTVGTAPAKSSEDGQKIEYVTDFEGNVTATISVSDEPESEDETEPETTTLSEFEQFIADQSNPPPDISGFNHGQYDEDGNPKPTLPPDFTLIIQ